MRGPVRYRIRRIEAMAGAKFGCAGGTLVALPLGLVVGWLARVLVGLARYTMEGWQQVPLDLGLAQVPLDVVALLRLSDWLAQARFWDDAPVLVIGGATLMAIALVGSVGSLLGWIGAGVYNALAAFSGGLAIDLEEIE